MWVTCRTKIWNLIWLVENFAMNVEIYMMMSCLWKRATLGGATIGQCHQRSRRGEQLQRYPKLKAYTFLILLIWNFQRNRAIINTLLIVTTYNSKLYSVRDFTFKVSKENFNMGRVDYLAMKTGEETAANLINSDLNEFVDAAKKLVKDATMLGGLSFGTSFLQWAASISAMWAKKETKPLTSMFLFVCLGSLF